MSRNSDSGKFEAEYNPSREDILAYIQRCEEEFGKVTRDKVLSEYPISRSNIENEFETFSKAKLSANLDKTGRVSLKQEELNNINKECSENRKLNSVIKGLLMGDGSLDYKGESNPCLSVSMINKRFLDYLKASYPRFFTDVKLKSTSSTAAMYARESGFRPEAKEENYHNFYTVRSRRLPFLNKYTSWYDSGEKRYPNDLKIDKDMVKMWYVGDGNVNHKEGSRSSITITCKNESDRMKFIANLFKEKGFNPKIRSKGAVEFLVDDAEKMLSWMGKPPNGFEYKWEISDNSNYTQLKQKTYTK